MPSNVCFITAELWGLIVKHSRFKEDLTTLSPTIILVVYWLTFLYQIEGGLKTLYNIRDVYIYGTTTLAMV